MRIAMAWLVGLTCLAATQSSAQSSSRRATASEAAPGGFMIRGPVIFSDFYEEGSGHVSIDTREVTAGKRQLVTGRARVELRMGADSYAVSLDVNAAHPGVVLFDQDIHGNTGLGSPGLPTVHAVTALSGSGSVTKNGRLLTDHAPIEVMALSAAAHADDSTHRLQGQARVGDGEIEVVAQDLPVGDEPRGFIDFVWDDVRLEMNGIPVPTIQTVPTGVASATLSPSAEGARLVAPTTLGTGGGGYGGYAIATGTGGAGQAGTTAGNPTTNVLPDATGTARGAAAAANGSTFSTANNGPAESSAGLPASPVVLNNGAAGLVPGPGVGPTVPPTFTVPATTLVATPAPLNSTAATPLPLGVAPLNASPALSATPANPVITGPSTVGGTPGVTPAR